MNFSIHEGSDQVLFRYDLRGRQSGELMTDRLQYLFLELPNCKRAMTPEATVLDNFCYALKYMSEWTDRPAGLEQEIFNLLFDSLVIAKFAPKERTKYINDMTTERDIKNQIDYARKEGEAKGNIETARKLIAEYGLDPEDVAKRLGMKKEDLQ